MESYVVCVLQGSNGGMGSGMGSGRSIGSGMGSGRSIGSAALANKGGGMFQV